MRSSWWHEPIKCFLLYAAAGVVVIPCSIVFAFLKSQGHGPTVLLLPLVVGVVGGLAVIARLENRPRSANASGPIPVRSKGAFGAPPPVLISEWRWLRLSRQLRRRSWELAIAGDRSESLLRAEEVASWARSVSAEVLEGICDVEGRYRRSWTRWFPNDSDEDRPVRALPDARRALTMEWIAHGLVFFEICLSALLIPVWFPILHALGSLGGALIGGSIALALGVITEACGAALVPMQSPWRAAHWVWGAIVFLGLLWFSTGGFIMLVRPITGPLALRLEPWYRIAFSALIVLNLVWAGAFSAGAKLWGWSGRSRASRLAYANSPASWINWKRVHAPGCKGNLTELKPNRNRPNLNRPSGLPTARLDQRHSPPRGRFRRAALLAVKIEAGTQ